MEKLTPKLITSLPGPKAKEVIAKDKAYSSPSYIKAYSLVVDRGCGPWIYDVDGNRFLDMMAGIATASTGHSHPRVVRAIRDASESFLHICGTDFYYELFSKMVEKLGSLLPKMGRTKVFLSNSGTESIEAAIKLVRYHTKRSNIIAFEGAFHGRTLGAISLTSSKSKYRAHFGPFLPGVYHTPYPDPFRYDETDSFSFALEKLEALFRTQVSPSEVAGIFIEPILGEGGYIKPTQFFLKELRKLCDEHGIVLVFDEVQSGNGRTGKMFASDLFDVYPDILVTAKGMASGLPLGAVIARESVMSWTEGTHGSTYGGNPLACAASLATYEIIEPILQDIERHGCYLLEKLEELRVRHPVIADVRGVGFMVGVEFADPLTGLPIPEFVSNLEQRAFTKGVLILSCGESSVRISPPLIVGRHELQILLETLEESVEELVAQYGY